MQYLCKWRIEEPGELIKRGNNEISEVEVEVEVEKLTIEDVKIAIRSLKNNKAAGTDGIHLELKNTEEINY